VGVDLWGLMAIGDTITLRVREAQSAETEYWLQRMGMPYECTVSPEAAYAARFEATQRHTAPSWADGE
jgi:hypothetical protein